MYFSSSLKKKNADFIPLYRRTRGVQWILPSRAYSVPQNAVDDEQTEVNQKLTEHLGPEGAD